MAFRFPLESLLRFRQHAERQQELCLQQAHLSVAVLRNKLHELDARARGILVEDMELMASGSAAAHLHFDAARRAVLLDHRPLLERELNAAEVRVTTQSEAYKQARRKREVVDTLRQQQWKAYQEQEGRQEQRRVDALFLLRREFLKSRKPRS
jgi:flagellar export protein FliJ